MFIKKTILNINKLSLISNQLRNYSKSSRLEEIERLREGYNTSRYMEENDLSKSIMERIKNTRRLAPSIHDSEFYSASNNNSDNNENNDEDEYLPIDNTMKINGRGAPKRIKRSDIEIVSMKDY